MPVRWTEEDGRAIWHLPSFDDMAPLKLAHDEYLFFLDMEGHRDAPAVASALAEAAATAYSHRVLGSFPRATAAEASPP